MLLKKLNYDKISCIHILVAEQSQPLTVKQQDAIDIRNARTKRIALLILAITIHNIPEGLAVGVGFAAGNFQNARNLAIGIGIQVMKKFQIKTENSNFRMFKILLKELADLKK